MSDLPSSAVVGRKASIAAVLMSLVHRKMCVELWKKNKNGVSTLLASYHSPKSNKMHQNTAFQDSSS